MGPPRLYRTQIGRGPEATPPPQSEADTDKSEFDGAKSARFIELCVVRDAHREERKFHRQIPI